MPGKVGKVKIFLRREYHLSFKVRVPYLPLTFRIGYTGGRVTGSQLKTGRSGMKKDLIPGLRLRF